MAGADGGADVEPFRGRVAIIMRTKNRSLLLERAVDDVLAQTFSDWCLVIVDDGGDAEAVDAVVARRETAFDGRVRVVHNAESVGMERASNLGIENSDSEFIAVHDDDDTWHPEFLTRLVGHLDAHPGDAAAVARIEIVWERIVHNEIEIIGREPFGQAVTDVLLSDHMLYNRFVPISLLYRRAIHEVVGMFEGGLPVVGDWHFNLRMLAHFRVVIVEGEPMAFWHQRREGLYGNTVTTSQALHRRYDGIVRNEAFAEYVREHGPGLPLYITGFVDGRLLQVEQAMMRRIDELEARLLARADEPVALRSQDRLAAQVRGLLRRIFRFGRR